MPPHIPTPLRLTTYIALALSLLSLLTAWGYNEWNVKALSALGSPKLDTRYHYIHTADDAAYIRPAQNYYEHGVWRDNNPGRQAYFLRTPGYGLFRYGLMRLMGLDKSYQYFKYAQLLLFAISVFLLYQLALLVGLSPIYGLVVIALYGVSPFASGFLYYSLTEGISPALVIGYSWALAMGYRRQRWGYYLVASVFLSLLILTRPVLGILGIGLPLAIALRERNLLGLRLICLTSIIALAPIACWLYRSYCIGGTINIYPIYYLESNSQFRPTHKAIWDFAKSYGTTGECFHLCMTPLWQGTRLGDTTDRSIDTIMARTPQFVVAAIGESALRLTYQQYRISISYQCRYYPRSQAMPDTIPTLERSVIARFESYTCIINSKFWSYCHLMVPLMRFRDLALHSNLSLHIFQHTYRGQLWLELLRVFFLLLHTCCSLAWIGVLLWSRDSWLRGYLGLLVGVYIWYLCYCFRGLEERYTLPLLPLMLLGLGLVLEQIGKLITEKFYS